MPYLSPSLFIKEPGRTKNLTVGSPNLKKEVKRLKAGDVLDVKTLLNKATLLIKHTKTVIAEIEDEKIVKKIAFTFANRGEILVIFVSLVKGTKSPRIMAQFLVKSSLPVFPEEAANSELRPFTRSGEIPQDDDSERPVEDSNGESGDETVTHDDTDPLSGLTIVNKEDLGSSPLEEE